MYSLKVEGDFSSAHNLRGYKGKCEALHGHNWKVSLEIRGEKLDGTGMLADFTFLKSQLKTALEGLDHQYLNEHPYFKKVNPTSEHISRYIYESLEKKIPGIHAVTVWESENSSATYYGR